MAGKSRQVTAARHKFTVLGIHQQTSGHFSSVFKTAAYLSLLQLIKSFGAPPVFLNRCITAELMSEQNYSLKQRVAGSPASVPVAVSTLTQSLLVLFQGVLLK